MQEDFKYFILKDKIPIACSLLDWARFFNTFSNRFVVRNELLEGVVAISTVFLGIDHSFSMEKDHIPVLFETMIFGGTLDQTMNRYCTWEQAEEGHANMVAQVKKNLEKWDKDLKNLSQIIPKKNDE
jgi:hypothetical protein